MGKDFAEIKPGRSLLMHSLHSGGIRGIVELEILRLIQKALGANIPIQDFFDLIVGTRYSPVLK